MDEPLSTATNFLPLPARCPTCNAWTGATGQPGSCPSCIANRARTARGRLY